MVVVSNSLVNPYKGSNDYKMTTTEKGVEYQGKRYSKKITYEKKIDTIHRLGLGVLAFLSLLTIVPYLCLSQKVTMWWQQAIEGVDRKIVLIKEISGERHVQFGDVRARLFKAQQPPGELHWERSIELEIACETGEEISRMPQERGIPPLGTHDTVFFSHGRAKSAHGTGLLFKEDEIVERLDIIKRVKLAVNEFADAAVYANFTEYGKAIIQQQATRGCTAGVTAMLIVDNGKAPNLGALMTRNLANDETMEADIKAAGLKIVKSGASDLSQLRALLIQHGSAIVTIGGIGAHVVVVDEVSEDLSTIRLRDPYHGWEITVTSDSFLSKWAGGKVIQIQKD